MISHTWRLVITHWCRLVDYVVLCFMTNIYVWVDFIRPNKIASRVSMQTLHARCFYKMFLYYWAVTGLNVNIIIIALYGVRGIGIKVMLHVCKTSIFNK